VKKVKAEVKGELRSGNTLTLAFDLSLILRGSKKWYA
jgi:hypothetical protein